MVTNSSILPHPCLSDFILRYTLCHVDPGVDMAFPVFATHESCLYFSLGDLPVHVNISEKTNKISLCGLLTHSNGFMKLQGNCKDFIVEFKPDGFNTLFGIAANEICNSYFPAEEVLGKRIEYFYEQLLTALDIGTMALLADTFLIGFLNKKKAIYNEGISKISSLLITASHTINVAKYASLANMSVRNFERRFTEQIGTSPKLFCRLVRFNKTVQFKIAHPQKNWTELAYEFGYFDQMHLIKEFKEFTNETPLTFFKNNPDLMNESFDTIERTL